MEKFYLHLTAVDPSNLHPSIPTEITIEAEDTPLALNLMVAVGWIHASASPFSRRDWPRRPTAGAVRTVKERYEAQCDELLRYHGDTAETIPSYKLGTNEGWIITPDEIRAAFAEWYPVITSDPLFAVYSHLRMALRTGGTRVRLEAFDG